MNDFEQKLNAAIGLISAAEHRMNQAWNQSYDDLVDASNILVSLKGKKGKQSNDGVTK